MFHPQHRGAGTMSRRWSWCLSLCLVALALLQGCAAANSAMGGNTPKQARAEVSWDAGKDGVLLEITAATDLNLFQNLPHTLLLTVFQMADAAAFHKLVGDPQQLSRALESGQAGPAFVQLTRYVVAPGRRTLLSLDRAQQSRYIGIVAGYYQIDAEGNARLFEVPLAVSSKGWISNTYSAEPVPLAVRLHLGAQAILAASSLNTYPVPKKDSAWIPLDGGGREIELAPQPGEGADPAARKL
jgi:type VI secretion system VasD/TssJ family lipoprotein